MIQLADDNIIDEQPPYGRLLFLRSAWHRDLEHVIAAKSVNGIAIRPTTHDSLQFLSSASLPGIDTILVTGQTTVDCGPLAAMSRLRVLHLLAPTAGSLDCASLPLLEAIVRWSRAVSSIGRCVTLEKLSVEGFDGLDLTNLSQLVALRKLFVMGGRPRSLRGVEALIALHHLRLENLRQLESFEGAQALGDLHILEGNSCKHLHSVDQLGMLRNLQRLHLCDGGKIDSLKPLASLERLRVLLFYGTTNVLDGDLAFLDGMPSLQQVAFQDRRHYNRSSEQLKMTGMVEAVEQF